MPRSLEGLRFSPIRETSKSRELRENLAINAARWMDKLQPLFNDEIIALIPFGSMIAGTAMLGSDMDIFILIKGGTGLYFKTTDLASKDAEFKNVHLMWKSTQEDVFRNRGDFPIEQFGSFSLICFAQLLLNDIYTDTAEHANKVRDFQKEIVQDLLGLGHAGETTFATVREAFERMVVRYNNPLIRERRIEVLQELNQSEREWEEGRVFEFPTLAELKELYIPV